MGSIEDTLLKRGFLVYTSVGKSMLPLIREARDVLVIKRDVGELKKWDIVLAKRPSGRYLLHRIIKINADNTYTLCGDNNYIYDYNIRRSDIIGKLVAITKNGKEYNFKSYRYRLYVLFWCKPLCIRKIFLRLWNTLNTKICHHQKQ